MRHISSLALAGAVIVTSLAIANPAQAASRRVGYADLDMTSAAGRASMDQRLRKAAGAVCRAENRNLTLATACSRESIVQARADLGRALDAHVVRMASR